MQFGSMPNIDCNMQCQPSKPRLTPYCRVLPPKSAKETKLQLMNN